MSNPHESAPDEVPTEHIGEEIPDPWSDPEQTDWATTGSEDRGWSEAPFPSDPVTVVSLPAEGEAGARTEKMVDKTPPWAASPPTRNV